MTGDWRSIDTAPRDGQHILVRSTIGAGYGYHEGRQIPFVTVAHWYAWPEGGEPGGFYPSSYGTDPDALERLTDWMPIPD